MKLCNFNVFISYVLFLDLEMQFHGAIAYGVNKKPSTLHATQWKQCSLVLSKYLLAQPTSDVMDAATTIMDQLKFLLEEGIFCLYIKFQLINLIITSYRR